MMMKSMIATALAMSALPCEASIRRLYRIQPTQRVMPSSPSSSTNHAEFEKFDDDAQRALRELMVLPERHLSLEIISSMEFLSLSYAPIMSMTPPPTMMPTPDGTATMTDESTTVSTYGVAPITAGNGRTKNTTDFNKPATISVTVFLLIAAMAVTALVIRKYKRSVMIANGSSDDQSTLSGPSVVSNSIPVV
jgi:hypothetical protein